MRTVMEATPTPVTSALALLLRQLRPQRARRLSSREVRMELASATLLGLAVAGLAIGFGARHTLPALDVVLLIGLVAACSQVRLYVGGGYGVPTQLALVPILFLLPPAAAPAMMAAGFACAAAVDIARGRAHPDRALPAIGDAWHAVGPAIVFGLAGSPSPDAGHWLLMVP